MSLTEWNDPGALRRVIGLIEWLAGKGLTKPEAGRDVAGWSFDVGSGAEGRDGWAIAGWHMMQRVLWVMFYERDESGTLGLKSDRKRAGELVHRRKHNGALEITAAANKWICGNPASAGLATKPGRHGKRQAHLHLGVVLVPS